MFLVTQHMEYFSDFFTLKPYNIELITPSSWETVLLLLAEITLFKIGILNFLKFHIVILQYVCQKYLNFVFICLPYFSDWKVWIIFLTPPDDYYQWYVFFIDQYHTACGLFHTKFPIPPGPPTPTHLRPIMV